MGWIPMRRDPSTTSARRRLDRPDDLRQKRGIVLIVGVHHHHDVGAGSQRFAIAGLLIGAVTVVAVVDEQLEAQFAGDARGFIRAAVIHHDHQVHHVLRQVGIGHVQSLGGVIGRHHHHDLGF